MSPVFTAQDPQFEVVCVPCRFGVGECVGSVNYRGDLVMPAGTYRCERRGRIARKVGR